MKKIFFATLLLVSANAFAQTSTEKKEPYIDVVGTAEREVVPDEIFIRIVLRERYDSKEKISIEKQESDLKIALKNIGIDIAKNLSLADADADYVKVKWNKKDVVTQKRFTLKVADATAVSSVYQQLDSLNIKDASILKVSYSKLDSLKKEVRILAIKDAKNKAEYLLTAIGEEIGKPVFISDSQINSFGGNISQLVSQSAGVYQQDGIQIRGSREGSAVYYVNGVKQYGTPTVPILDDEVQFQKIKVTTSITARFLIK